MASGPFSTTMSKSASVRTGPGGRTEQVITSYSGAPSGLLARPKIRWGMPSSNGRTPSSARTATRWRGRRGPLSELFPEPLSAIVPPLPCRWSVLSVIRKPLVVQTST